MNGLRDSERTLLEWADGGASMVIETRIDRIERRRASGEIDVVYVITREGYSPRLARLNGEEFPRQDGETLHDLADRCITAVSSAVSGQGQRLGVDYGLPPLMRVR